MKFAVVDFETTGSLAHDEIIQVGLVIIDDLQIVQSYASFVKPTRSIPYSITLLTGINDHVVKDSPSLVQVMKELHPLIADCVLVGHHVSFDLGFLQKSLVQSGFPRFSGRVLDTIEALRILFPSMHSFQLSLVAEYFGIAHERPHQADSDAEVTAEIWLVCMQRLLLLPIMTVQRLCQVMDDDTNDLGWFFHEIRQFKEMNTAVDQDTSRYFRQFTINVQDWDDDTTTTDQQLQRNPPDADDVFHTFYTKFKQTLQEKFQLYEDRDAQEQMIAEVAASFEAGRHLMVEAGTGTGKSLGYLIPSLYYAVKHDKKVIVSTHTINLQEQLWDRDIPLLHELFPVDFRAAVLKGRSHYLCLRKFENKINMKDFEYRKEDSITAAQMVVWLSETKQGDEEELHFGNKGAQFWQNVASDTDSCLNRQCPWFKKCFYHRAKFQSNEADLIITNHSLLFTDMKADHRLLRHYKHLVIDEAHHFEEVASKHLGTAFHAHRFVHSLVRLYKDNRSGYLPMMRFRLQKLEEHNLQPSWISAIDQLYPQLVETKERWDLLSEKLCMNVIANSDYLPTDAGQYVLRIKQEQLPKDWQDFVDSAQDILLLSTGILKALEKLWQQWKEHCEEYEMQSSLTDLSGVMKDLSASVEALQFFVKLENDNYVYWIEVSQYAKSKSLQLHSVPIDVSQLLQSQLFEIKDSIVMTSATLAVNQSFQYSAQQLGLHIPEDEQSNKLKTLQLESPFDFKHQALVCIPKDFPDIKSSVGERVFVQKLLESLSDIAIITKGRMLVLFTSNRMLKEIYTGLKERLQPHGIEVLGQGVGSGNRSKLTRLFQERPASVLLGTNSFWEGVDIPGDALSCLAIVKLPFQPPNHPIIEAKCEKIKKRNENPFMKYSLPQAVIRFKQGFGRLVRRATDRGVVIIYDNRVIESSYGKYFLHSLPGPHIEQMSSAFMPKRIEQWMEDVKDEVVKNL